MPEAIWFAFNPLVNNTPNTCKWFCSWNILKHTGMHTNLCFACANALECVSFFVAKCVCEIITQITPFVNSNLFFCWKLLTFFRISAWQIDKLGTWIAPQECAINSSAYTHAVNSGVRLINTSSLLNRWDDGTLRTSVSSLALAFPRAYANIITTHRIGKMVKCCWVCVCATF